MLKRLLAQGWMQEIIGFLVFAYIETVRRSIRWEVRGMDFIDQIHTENKPIIGVFWHGRITMALEGWNKHRDRMMAVASRSRDAEPGQKLVNWYGVKLARGSSRNRDKPGKSKGGERAYREVLRHVCEGGSAAFTPDGPRGPRMRAGFGPVLLARDSGVPIVPFSWSTRRKTILQGSWDKHYLPAYFTTGVIIWGNPIYVPQDATQDQLEAFRQKMEDEMNRISLEADEAAGGEGVRPAEESRPKTGPDGVLL